MPRSGEVTCASLPPSRSSLRNALRRRYKREKWVPCDQICDVKRENCQQKHRSPNGPVCNHVVMLTGNGGIPNTWQTVKVRAGGDGEGKNCIPGCKTVHRISKRWERSSHRARAKLRTYSISPPKLYLIMASLEINQRPMINDKIYNRVAFLAKYIRKESAVWSCSGHWCIPQKRESFAENARPPSYECYQMSMTKSSCLHWKGREVETGRIRERKREKPKWKGEGESERGRKAVEICR